MKIIFIGDDGKSCSINLPEWTKDRRLILLAGVELVFEKLPWDDFIEVKEGRCSHCGQCCMEFGPNSSQTVVGVDDEGKCKALVLESGGKWVCSIAGQRLGCFQDPTDVEKCSVVRKRVKLE